MKQWLGRILPPYTPDYIVDEIDRHFWKKQIRRKLKEYKDVK